MIIWLICVQRYNQRYKRRIKESLRNDVTPVSDILMEFHRLDHDPVSFPIKMNTLRKKTLSDRYRQPGIQTKRFFQLEHEKVKLPAVYSLVTKETWNKKSSH